MRQFAAVFPGQGSQSIGMLQELIQAFSVVRETFEQASDVLGYDTRALALNGPVEKLNETTVTQPLLLTAGVAVFRAFAAQTDQPPVVLAGHSLGEYSAFVASDALAFETALTLVQERAQAMQRAVPLGEGAMAAVIGLTDAQIINWCLEHSTPDAMVSPVNFNAPGQVVIAGHAHAIEKAAQGLKALGAKRVLPLPVSVPSHCQLMASAAAHMRPMIESVEWSDSPHPVIQNVDAQVHDTCDSMKQALIDQLSSPVQWVASMKTMERFEVDAVFEMGPGQVLCGLQKRINKDIQAFSLGTLSGFEAGLSWLSGENND